MIKIAVLSDTHIPNRAIDLPQEFYDRIKDVELIIHAGDVVGMSFMKKLKKMKEVAAVCGNMDSEELRKEFPKSRILSKYGFKIGIFHGNGSPKRTLENVKSRFSQEELDVIIFGHTHVAFNKKIDNTVYFNPGSPTDKIFSPYNSFGIISIDNTNIYPEIIKIER